MTTTLFISIILATGIGIYNAEVVAGDEINPGTNIFTQLEEILTLQNKNLDFLKEIDRRTSNIEKEIRLISFKILAIETNSQISVQTANSSKDTQYKQKQNETNSTPFHSELILTCLMQANEKLAENFLSLEEGIKNQSQEIKNIQRHNETESEFEMGREIKNESRNETESELGIGLETSTKPEEINPVEVEASPQIVKFPKSQKVRAGSIATFICRVSGHPLPKVEWQKDGKKITSANIRIQILNFYGNSMLRIEPVRHRRDDGNYECLAKNKFGIVMAMASAQLTVFSESELPSGFPVIVEGPLTKVVDKGGIVSLKCLAAGTSPLTITWFKDTLPIQPASDGISFEGVNREILNISNAQELHAGAYECAAENSVGTEISSPSARIYIRQPRGPPVFSLPPDPIYEVKPGNALNVTCVAIGSPMPTVRWRKGSEELTKDGIFRIGKDVLMLRNIHDTNVYTCVASSSLGSAERNTTVKAIDS